jgi:alpha-tubulin suppressor-like RCC1 family protein
LYDSTLSAGVIAEHYEVGEGGPKASFVSSPVVASAGVPVRFDASGSSSPAGSVIDYAWDFDGGKSYSSDEGASATVSHTFSSPGTYTVDLRVKDSLGEIATVSKTIVVNAALGAYEQAVEKTAGVSHFWPMGESSGSSFADAIAGDNAELTSGVTLGEAGGLVDDSATSALFDGSTGTAHAGVDLSSTHELTVEFWMKWGAYASDDRLALEFTPNFNEYSGGFLIDPDATPGSDFAVSIGRSTSRNTVYFERPSAGIWHYYAFVIDTEAAAETQITPYVDGHTMSYTKSESGTGSGDFANSTLYWMSRDASSLFGAGSMQDLAIYSTTISSSVVLEHYERGENTYMAANTTAPSIEGTLKDGLTLIASPGVWLGASPISYTYQWQSCNTAGGECQDITGATGKTYTLETTDIDTTVRVAVTASNPGGSVQATSAASTEVKAGAPSELEGPSISGTPDAGETLDGHAGNWGGSETMVSYQWEACNASGGECLDIAGANSLDYELSSGDVGDTLRLRVGVSNSLGSLTALSASTEVVGAVATLLNISVPSIVGTPQRGHTLTANAGSWLGATTISYTYVWHRCNYYGYACEAIAGATESTYTLGSEDTGHTLQVVVTASEASASTSETSPVTLVIAQEGAPIAEEHPTISGTGFVGYTLNAINGGWAGEEPLSYSYQWKRCDEYGESCSSITGATGSTYTLTESDAGGTIRVLVTAISSAGSTASSGAAVAVSPATLTKVSAPSVAGEDERGRPLSADPGIWTGEDEIAYSYQWQRCTEKGEACTDISGATEPFYTPGASDVGYALKVGVTASGTAGSESSASSLTPAITSPPTAPESQLTPSIEGNPTTGEALSAQPGWWLGSEPIAYTYQWQRCNPEGEECANILEATSETYLLTGADLGSTIQVTVTATNSLGDASATSHQSEAISAPGPPSSSKGPTIQGTAQEGKKIFATNGTWSGSRPLTYVYRWERCTAAGESCSAIEGATKPGYTVNSADLNSTLRIKVTVTNSDGTSSALSPLTIVSAAGEANTSEALEIAEATDPSILAASTTANIEEQSIKPVVEDPGEELSSSSAPTSSSISKETPGEFAVDTADSELSLQPISTSPAATKTPTVVNGAAALFAETSRATDTIVRPDALGVTTLLQLRSAEAPTTFSWEVGLGARQQLEELPGGSIAVTEPPSSSPIEGALSEESFGAPETKAAETGGSGVTAGAAEEELESFLGEESPLESLPSAPQVSTPTITPESGELHPQETRSQYEHDTTALASAKTASANKVLMVIEPPVVMDAVGHTVTASLSIKGNTVTLTISPSLEVTFPVTAATVVASAGEASSAPEPRYGLADKEPADFTTAEEEPGKTTTNFDKHLEVGPLHVKVARDYVPYNANAEVLIPWLEAVKKDKLEPYITFESPQNCTVGEPCAAENDPSIAQYSTGVERIISGVKRIYEENKTGKEIPEVKLWGAWNEPDFKSNAKYDPLYRSAWKAALFWKVARVALRTAGCSCTMVAGEFAEYTSYIQRYKETVLKNHTYWPRKPAVWGLHDYHDVVHAYQDVKHRGSTTVYRNPDAEKFTQALGKRVGHPHIMLSEQGVELENNSTASILLEGSPPEQEEHQRIAALDFLRLLSTSERRIELIDYYEYRGPSKEKIEKEHNPAYFDSALLHGSERHEALEPREAYCVIALGKEGCRPVTSSQEPVPGTTSSTGSTVVLEIDPRGLPTSYRVEYGVTTEYGQTSTATAVASSIGRQSEVVALTGLEPCTTYHYQAEAESPASEGSPSLGGDKTFQTPGCRLPALTVAVGGSFACAVLGDDGVDCWGDNEYGELGDGSTVNSETPVPVNGITSAVAIATGFDTACALLTDGGVDCWGDNEYGQLGNGTTTNSSVPVSVSGVNNAVAVSVGGDDSCALLTTGHVACWGRNDNGQLGNETVTDSATPVTVTGISSATAISAGYFSTCAVLADGGIECWGDNEWDELGYLGTTLPKSTKPVPTPEKGAASAVEAGFEHTCALLSGGGIECWGNTKIGTPYNGIFTEGRLTPSPVAVSGITDATRIAGYTFTTCSSLASGEVNCWGDDEYGQLGDNTTIPLFEGGSTTPVKVSGISDTIALSAGAGSICTLGSTGEIYCWGDNEDGELGDGGTENSSTPVSVTGIG